MNVKGAGAPMEKDGQLGKLLLAFAQKYIWWKNPAESALFPDRIVAQVMELGTFQDMQELIRVAGEQRTKEVLQRAEAGWFTPRSWHYWHLRLGLCEVGHVPPLPKREIR